MPPDWPDAAAQISAAAAWPPVARLCRRSTISMRMPAATAVAARVNASRTSAAQRYQRRNAPLMLETASSRRPWPAVGSKAAVGGRVALHRARCVSAGRSGPKTCSRAMSSLVLPICTSRAGPATDSSVAGPRPRGAGRGDDVLVRGERDGERDADGQAEEHEQQRRPGAVPEHVALAVLLVQCSSSRCGRGAGLRMRHRRAHAVAASGRSGPSGP